MQLLQFSGVRPGVATVAVSSAGFGSGSVADTVAVLLNALSLIRVPAIATVALPPEARSSRAQVMVWAAVVHAPWLAVTAPGFTAAGRGSITVTFVAFE